MYITAESNSQMQCRFDFMVCMNGKTVWLFFFYQAVGSKLQTTSLGSAGHVGFSKGHVRCELSRLCWPHLAKVMSGVNYLGYAGRI